jgi:cytidine deaminase
MEKKYNFTYQVFETIDQLAKDDAELLAEARKITQKAYAPYSNFLVGAAAVLNSGQKVFGTNQENASYPVGICAERVLLASASMLHTDEPIKTMAISYNNLSRKGDSDRPITPCGMCRQSLAEYELRTQQHMRLIMSGMEGIVIVVERASELLPFSFTADSMK